jgi:hypothetical protein
LPDEGVLLHGEEAEGEEEKDRVSSKKFCSRVNAGS